MLGRTRLMGTSGEEVKLPAKAIALLAHLALEHGQRHPRRQLAELLWPGKEPDAARRNLRLTLHRVRDAVQRQDGHGPDGWLDSDRETVRVLIRQPASARDPRAAAGLSCDVLDLLDGRPTTATGEIGLTAPEDCGEYSLWLASWKERVAVAWRGRLHAEGETALTDGRHGEAERIARVLVRAAELDESGHELLMRVLLAAGRPDEALRCFDNYAATMRRELGVGPGEQLQHLLEEAHGNGNRRGRVPELDPDVPLSTDPIPVPLTSFHGRQKELRELGDALRSRGARILSVIGPGGMGKTRLCLEVARTAGRYFQEGAALVRLDDVTDVGDVPFAIASSLGLTRVATAADPLAALTDCLVEREVLLVLDNAEHLLAASGDQPAKPSQDGPGLEATLVTLVEACPHVASLVSSRRPLGIPGEARTHLQGLSYPPRAPRSGSPDPGTVEGFDAVRMLVDRLHRVDKRLKFQTETAAEIVEVCQLVEGMPLGLELVASAVRDEPLTQVAARLRSRPDDVAPVVDGTPARHADLGAVYRYSVALLEPADQALLPKLSVFAARFDAGAAADITGATPTSLARLCQASLLSRDADGRYRMHVMLRQMASRDLQLRVRDAHAAHYLGVLAGVAEASRGPAAAKTFDALRADRANHLEAWQHAIDRGWADRLVAASDGLMAWAIASGEVPQVATLLRSAREVCTDPVDVATMLLREVTALRPTVEDFGSLVPPAEEALDLIAALDADALGEYARRNVVSLRGRLHLFIATCRNVTDDPPDEVARLALRAGREADESGDAGLQGFVLYHRAGEALGRDAVDEAAQLMRHAIDVFESSDNLRGLAIARKGLAWTQLDSFQPWHAYETSRAALEDFRLLGNALGQVYVHEIVAEALTRLGSFRLAVPLLERALADARQLGATGHRAFSFTLMGMALWGAGDVDRARATFSDAVQIARSSDRADWLRFALAPWTRFLIDQGHVVQAELCARELLRSAESADAPITLLSARALLARVLVDRGDLTEAATLAQQAADALQPRADGTLRLVDALDTAAECATALDAAGRGAEASRVWALGHATMRQVAESITVPEFRTRFLDDLPACRVIQQAGLHL